MGRQTLAYPAVHSRRIMRMKVGVGYMIDDVNAALVTYGQKWDTLVAGCKNKQFFADLKPTAVGWKTADRAEYDRLLAELHDRADMIFEKWINGPLIAT